MLVVAGQMKFSGNSEMSGILRENGYIETESVSCRLIAFIILDKLNFKVYHAFIL